jgi:hypothetical protein
MTLLRRCPMPTRCYGISITDDAVFACSAGCVSRRVKDSNTYENDFGF